MSKIVERFFQAIQSQPLAAVMLLGNLLQNEDKIHCESTRQISQKITDEQVYRLVESSLLCQQEKNKLLDREQHNTILHVQHEMLRNIDFLRHVSTKHLTQLAQKESLLLEVLLAAIKKQDHKIQSSSPLDSWDYVVLEQGSLEQLTGIFHPLIADCSIPIAVFKKIGTISSAYAKQILTLLAQHPSRFTLAEYFLGIHPELRKEIFQTWIKTQTSIPLTQAEQHAQRSVIENAKNNYPQLKEWTEAERINQYQPIKQTTNHLDYSFNLLCGTCSVLSAYALGVAAFTCGGPVGLGMVSLKPIVTLTAVTLIESYCAFNTQPKVLPPPTIAKDKAHSMAQHSKLK